jgi:hypothetical protein
MDSLQYFTEHRFNGRDMASQLSSIERIIYMKGCYTWLLTIF